ncbi:MAG: sulfatase-like hydrolase/transferase [Verrucomicrobia bacterium]|nr:sulfatase-like hydrolase/transferase [Verrucomicrobiota bacterium]MDA1069597.1 sulfatase-like hydrolase/transferase [Verrucomicrobiota bacterium]
MLENDLIYKFQPRSEKSLQLGSSLLLGLLMVLILASAVEAKPNIVIILADDLGYGDVSCYNPEAKVRTQNLDRLAMEGMRFTDAHSPSTVCTPTRYSIMTGQMVFRLNYPGVFTGVGGPGLITEDRLTLPGMLRDQGYETALFGKWHIGMSFLDKNGAVINVEEPPRGTSREVQEKVGLDAVNRIDYSRAIPDSPIHRGFDHFFGTVCCPTSDWLYAFIDGDRIPMPPTQILDRDKLPKHEWSFDCRVGMVAPGFNHEEVDMVFLEKSLEFLDTHSKEKPRKPFFLFHSLQAVHLPSFPGKDFQGKTTAGPHGDFIYQFDHIVGQLMNKLEDLGIAEDTLVIVTSDNGPEVGTVINMRSKYQHDGARPWRGVKRDNWEGGHRVPMIARWPGKVEAGSIADQTVCLTDIMATCAAIVDAKLPNDAAEDSFDILPVLLGEAKDEIRGFTLHQTISLDLAIRKGDWKYLDHKGSGGNSYDQAKLKPYALPDTAPNAPGQLYNLKRDPGETKNLYFEHPEIVRELKNKLEQSKKSGRSAPRRL